MNNLSRLKGKSIKLKLFKKIINIILIDIINIMDLTRRLIKSNLF
jgi:hypothetical protein